MSLLRRVRTELTGAWRSVRYDMGRRAVEPPPGGPDVTSTGMNTFGGNLFAELAPDATDAPDTPVRRPRRALAVTGLGVLTVVGATGAYLGVVNGLGSLLNETSASAGTVPARPAATSPFTADAGIGQGPAAAVPGSPRTRTDGAVPAAGAPGPATTGLPATGLPATGPGATGPATTERAAIRPNASPIRTIKPAKPGCPCDSPPVPTPTAPSSSTVSPVPSPSVSPSDPVSPGETSATPANSVEPSESAEYRHRYRRH